MPESTPPTNARVFFIPSLLSGIEMIAPSGKFCIAISIERARAPAALISVLPETNPARTTPTAMPSGMLWSVTASTIIVVFARELFTPSVVPLIA